MDHGNLDVSVGEGFFEASGLKRYDGMVFFGRFNLDGIVIERYQTPV